MSIRNPGKQEMVVFNSCLPAFLIKTLLPLSVVGSCASSSDRNPRNIPFQLTPRWSESCPLLKRSLSAESSILFSPWRAPKPSPTAKPSVPWTLAFGDVAISFPPGRYEVLPSRNDRGDDVSVILLDNDGIAASFIRMPPSEPLRDVFARAGGVVRASGNETAFTLKVFGSKFPTNLDLLKIAYRHFPSDLKCTDAAALNEIPIAVGLVLKGLGPRNAATLSVHENLFGLGGITYAGKRSGASNQWDIETHFETKSASYIVGFMWKSREKMDEGAASISIKPCKKTCDTVGPSWLVDLASAVAAPLSKAAWERLGAELSRSGAGARTARSIKRLIDSGK